MSELSFRYKFGIEHILNSIGDGHPQEEILNIDIDQVSTYPEPPVIPVDTGPPVREDIFSRNGLFAKIPRRPLSKKAISRGTYECSRLCRVYDLDLTDPMISKIPRGGIVYYTFQNPEKQIFVCFGRDRFSRDLTDFGGHRRNGETPIQCAVREGNEESRFAFGELTPEDVQWFWCLYNSQMLIIFVNVTTGMNENIFKLTAEHFTSGDMIPCQYIRVKNGIIIVSRCCNEISEIVWLDENKIDDILSDHSRTKVYGRVRRFIRSCPEFGKSASIIRDKLLEICDFEPNSKSEFMTTDSLTVETFGTLSNVTPMFSRRSPKLSGLLTEAKRLSCRTVTSL